MTVTKNEPAFSGEELDVIDQGDAVKFRVQELTAGQFIIIEKGYVEWLDEQV